METNNPDITIDCGTGGSCSADLAKLYEKMLDYQVKILNNLPSNNAGSVPYNINSGCSADTSLPNFTNLVNFLDEFICCIHTILVNYLCNELDYIVPSSILYNQAITCDGTKVKTDLVFEKTLEETFPDFDVDFINNPNYTESNGRRYYNLSFVLTNSKIQPPFAICNEALTLYRWELDIISSCTGSFYPDASQTTNFNFSLSCYTEVNGQDNYIGALQRQKSLGTIERYVGTTISISAQPQTTNIHRPNNSGNTGNLKVIIEAPLPSLVPIVAPAAIFALRNIVVFYKWRLTKI